MKLSRWRNPLLLLLFSFFVIQFITYKLYSSFWTTPPATQVNRNERIKRGWPEYTSGERIKGTKHIIFIGTSQSFGDEIEDDKKIYPSIIRQNFLDEGIQVTLENWSLGGIRTVDIEMLLLKAIQKKPDLIVLGLDVSNFDRNSNRNLTFPNTDVNLFLADPRIFSSMKNSLLNHPLDEDIRIRKIAERYLPLVRSRTKVHTQIAQKFDLSNEDQLFYFGNPVTRGVIPDINVVKNYRDVLMFRHRKTPYFIIDKQEMGEKYFAAKRFTTLLKERLKGSDIKVMYSWIPLSYQHWDKGEFNKIKKFRKTMKTWNAKEGIADYDFLEAIPDSDFITVSHLKLNGHSKIAKLIYPAIKNELQ